MTMPDNPTNTSSKLLCNTRAHTAELEEIAPKDIIHTPRARATMLTIKQIVPE